MRSHQEKLASANAVPAMAHRAAPVCDSKFCNEKARLLKAADGQAPRRPRLKRATCPQARRVGRLADWPDGSGWRWRWMRAYWKRLHERLRGSFWRRSIPLSRLIALVSHELNFACCLRGSCGQKAKRIILVASVATLRHRLKTSNLSAALPSGPLMCRQWVWLAAFLPLVSGQVQIKVLLGTDTQITQQYAVGVTKKCPEGGRFFNRLPCRECVG